MICSAATRSIIRPAFTSSPRFRRIRPKSSRLRRSAPLIPSPGLRPPSPRFAGRGISRESPSYSSADTAEHRGDRLSPDLLDVVLILEHDAEGLFDDGFIECVAIERDQRRGPFERLGDAGHLVELGLPELLHECRDLTG